jgi:hypothetical protein
MIKTKLVVSAAALMGAALALPGVASAQAPTQDSVVLTPPGATPIAGEHVLFTINATSGPSGENPTGQLAFMVFGALDIHGPVTCLAVRGNTATINIRDEGSLSGFIITVQVVDGQPDTFDSGAASRAPTDCSPLPPLGIGGALSDGDITVVDAQPPLPTRKDQCKNGGWRRFGFKNQGQCIRFVTHGPKK